MKEKDGIPDRDLEKRFQSLSHRLNERRGSEKGDETKRTDVKSGFARATRMSSEFIAAVLVGAAIGYFLDKFAGSAPWGMIVFLLLGFCAGVLNVLRTAGLVADAGSRTGGPKGPPHAN